MKYGELASIRDLLNKKFKGKPLTDTDYTVRDFIIIPSALHDKVTHQRFKYAIELGVPFKDSPVIPKPKSICASIPIK